MNKKHNKLIYSDDASLWDGSMQLAGKLEIWDTEVIFKLKDFEKSHLNLIIPIQTIEKLEEFLVYDLARNGLRILNKNGQFDLFVIDDLTRFKMLLLKAIEALTTNDKELV